MLRAAPRQQGAGLQLSPSVLCSSLGYEVRCQNSQQRFFHVNFSLFFFGVLFFFFFKERSKEIVSPLNVTSIVNIFVSMSSVSQKRKFFKFCPTPTASKTKPPALDKHYIVLPKLLAAKQHCLKEHHCSATAPYLSSSINKLSPIRQIIFSFQIQLTLRRPQQLTKSG